MTSAGCSCRSDNYIDKRPLLYPFLVSLAHDLTGYRVLNAFLVNVALHPLLLGLAWWLARRLAAGWPV